jgi:hypothetical protein
MRRVWSPGACSTGGINDVGATAYGPRTRKALRELSNIAKLACDMECKEQDRLSDHKRNRESDAGEPAHEQRALL